MFDTMAIAQRIKQARIDQNMTQLQLADAMGVSYQAVSNWERGNSMPDISKLADLCGVLKLSVSELLGAEEKTAATVTKAMEQEKLTVEELQEVALMLPPDRLRESLRDSQKPNIQAENRKVRISLRGTHKEKTTDTGKMDMSAILSLAPFLEESYLAELVEKTEVTDLSEVAALAPFLSGTTLDRMVSRCQEVGDFDTIMRLAPFLSRGTLSELLRQRDLKLDWEELWALAPFADQTALDELVDRILAEEDEDPVEYIHGLAPFLSEKTLQKILQRSTEE